MISFCTYVDFDQADDDTATTTTQDDDETGSGEHLTLSLLVIRLVTSSASATVSERLLIPKFFVSCSNAHNNKKRIRKLEKDKTHLKMIG